MNHTNFIVNLTEAQLQGTLALDTRGMSDLGFILEYCRQFNNFEIWLWSAPLLAVIMRWVYRKTKKPKQLYEDYMLLFIGFATLVNLVFVIFR